MRTCTLLILATALLLSTACPASASVRDGDRNFERAWRVFTARQTDKATKYFRQAAGEYGEALKEDPQSRTMRFSSSLLKAGMSFYYAGDYAQCVTAMKLAVRKDERIWEADIYTALAQARLNQKDAALKALENFLDAMSSQRVISDEVLARLPGMKDGSVSLAEGMESIEQSVQQQFVTNISMDHRDATPNERCDGAFWWRFSSAPCSTGIREYN